MSRVVAREWLLLLACLIAGAIMAIAINGVAEGRAIDLYDALILRNGIVYFWRVLMAIFGPYILVQFVRSVIWAIRRA